MTPLDIIEFCSNRYEIEVTHGWLQNFINTPKFKYFKFIENNTWKMDYLQKSKKMVL